MLQAWRASPLASHPRRSAVPPVPWDIKTKGNSFAVARAALGLTSPISKKDGSDRLVVNASSVGYHADYAMGRSASFCQLDRDTSMISPVRYPHSVISNPTSGQHSQKLNRRLCQPWRAASAAGCPCLSGPAPTASQCPAELGQPDVLSCEMSSNQYTLAVSNRPFNL